MSNSVDNLCVNTIRVVAADMVQVAKSGHPGMPMGMAPVTQVLFSKHLDITAKNPQWLNRDRWILSNGHGCTLQYIMLYLTGFLTLDDLKNFRQLGSRTPGHPENFLTPGVEVTTGPLGQGFANGIGMAIAQEYAKTKFNTKDFNMIDHYIYVFLGDGCLMEGVTSEAASLAGHLGLGSLIYIYDDNNITIDGKTNIAFTEDVSMRFKSYGWHVQTVEKGDTDLEAIDNAINEAKKIKDKPHLIVLKTTIGYGSKLEGTPKVHGAPLGEEEIQNVKKKFGFGPEKFAFPEEVIQEYKKISERSANKYKEWTELFEKYKNAHPDKAKELEDFISGKLPEKWEDELPKYSSNDKPIATRKLSGTVINKLAPVLPFFIGGSADLAESNMTNIKDGKDFQKGQYDGKNIRFGVREHAMAAIGNGMAAYAKGYIPFVATFLNFLGYCWGAARLSALSHFRVIYIMTHDSIGLGEDGPTHQPIEIIPLVRSTPNFYLMRPCDGNEVSGCYRIAIKSDQTPSCLCLTRQDLPHLDGTDIMKVEKGGYVLQDCEGKPDLIFVATGSEVSICVETAKLLKDMKVRVVSMPIVELFDKQDDEYRKSVLLEGVPVISVEASSTFGWAKYSHYQIGMKTFGISAPYKQVYDHFGITPEKIAEKAKELVKFYKGKAIPNVPSVADYDF
jgi:transketolase